MPAKYQTTVKKVQSRDFNVNSQVLTVFKQGLRYLSVGVINTLVGTGTMLILLAMGLSYWPATALGFSLGVLTSFILNRAFTFSYQGETHAAFIRFLLVTLVGYLVAFSLAPLLLSALWSRLSPSFSFVILAVDTNDTQVFHMISALVGTVLYTGMTFVGHRVWTFKKT